MEVRLKLPEEPVVQVSDTTKDDLKTDAGYQKNSFSQLLRELIH